MKQIIEFFKSLFRAKKAKGSLPTTPVSIKEEDMLHLAWYEEARKQTPATLSSFIEKLTTAYSHDYGTICHAVAAAAIGAAYSVDHSEQGGITGFQGSMIGQLILQKWNQWDHPYRILHWDKMLYPQYADTFTPVISKETWQWLQEQAREKLAKNEMMAKSVRAHMQLIVEGVPPFGWSVEGEEEGGVA